MEPAKEVTREAREAQAGAHPGPAYPKRPAGGEEERLAGWAGGRPAGHGHGGRGRSTTFLLVPAAAAGNGAPRASFSGALRLSGAPLRAFPAGQAGRLSLSPLLRKRRRFGCVARSLALSVSPFQARFHTAGAWDVSYLGRGRRAAPGVQSFSLAFSGQTLSPLGRGLVEARELLLASLNQLLPTFPQTPPLGTFSR